MSPPDSQAPSLQRVVGLFGAVGLGLGSILGTGVFVSLALVTGVAGDYALAAVACAGLLAIFNGLSSAQLAAAHPVSGGTYEYGYKYIHPLAGYAAGWLFLVAKSASAATAALGIAGYLAEGSGLAIPVAPTTLALIIVGLITLLAAGGLKRSSNVNTMIVTITLGVLGSFVVAGCFALGQGTITADLATLTPGNQPFSPSALMHATALAFVAYTGYGRVATLGEEVTEPRHTIPRAIIITLAVSMVAYISVAAVAIALVGPKLFASSAQTGSAPLNQVARYMGHMHLAELMTVGATIAMTGVLLNLVLGLSRVLLAMARRGDMPRGLSALTPEGKSPKRAVMMVGALIALMVSMGDITKTWSLSAFCVLIYYGTTNLAALKMPNSERLYPRIVSWLGIIGCLSLAMFIDRPTVFLGAFALIVGVTIRRLQPTAK